MPDKAHVSCLIRSSFRSDRKDKGSRKEKKKAKATALSEREERKARHDEHPLRPGINDNLTQRGFNRNNGEDSIADRNGAQRHPRVHHGQK